MIEWTVEQHLWRLMSKSKELFNNAQRFNERGAYMCHFNSVSQLVSTATLPLVFCFQKDLADLGDPSLNEYIKIYDPETQIVINVSVMILETQCRVGSKSTIVDKDACETLDLKSKGQLRRGNEFDPSIREVECVFCQLRSDKLLKCGACECVNYCDRICQKNDWPEHKKWCKELKQSRNNAIKLIK